MHDARQYFSACADAKKIKLDLSNALENASEENKASLQEHLKELEENTETQRRGRLERVNAYAEHILSLTEADTEEDTIQDSAKCLGTMLLITEGPVGNFALRHQAFKPLYKAILSLRLSDIILSKQKLKHSYLSQYVDAGARFKGDQKWQSRWQEGIAKPLIKAALFQDIGLQHPAAQRILNGDDGKKNPFRVLDNEERKTLLKLNYHHTLDYIKNGLGTSTYMGSNATEKDAFLAFQKQSHLFCLEAINDAFVTKNYLGELIKIPQIYASFVFSTKSDYSRKDLPKGYMIIEQLAKTEKLNQRIAESFLSLVGYFPQGFGISYIPKDEAGVVRDTHEYAIVNRLCPSKAAEPLCRIATRGNEFVRAGKNVTVARSENLYFQANHKKVKQADSKRLAQIRGQLNANYTDNSTEELVPSFWEPFTYFSERTHQNLWTKDP